VGNSPAEWLQIRPAPFVPKIGIERGFNVTQTHLDMLNQARREPPYPLGNVLFQGDEFTQDMTVVIPESEIKQATKVVEFIKITVVGYIQYGFVFDNSRHFTGFIFDVARSNRQRQISQEKNRSPSAIFPDEGDIPQNELTFYRSFLGSEFVD
jgi:hypothetical protein